LCGDAYQTKKDFINVKLISKILIALGLKEKPVYGPNYDLLREPLADHSLKYMKSIMRNNAFFANIKSKSWRLKHSDC
jgi:hypothetical protein